MEELTGTLQGLELGAPGLRDAIKQALGRFPRLLDEQRSWQEDLFMGAMFDDTEPNIGFLGAPRRHGKTRAVITFIAAYMYCKPNAVVCYITFWNLRHRHRELEDALRELGATFSAGHFDDRTSVSVEINGSWRRCHLLAPRIEVLRGIRNTSFTVFDNPLTRMDSMSFVCSVMAYLDDDATFIMAGTFDEELHGKLEELSAMVSVSYVQVNAHVPGSKTKKALA